MGQSIRKTVQVLSFTLSVSKRSCLIDSWVPPTVLRNNDHSEFLDACFRGTSENYFRQNVIQALE